MAFFSRIFSVCLQLRMGDFRPQTPLLSPVANSWLRSCARKWSMYLSSVMVPVLHLQAYKRIVRTPDSFTNARLSSLWTSESEKCGEILQNWTTANELNQASSIYTHTKFAVQFANRLTHKLVCPVTHFGKYPAMDVCPLLPILCMRPVINSTMYVVCLLQIFKLTKTPILAMSRTSAQESSFWNTKHSHKILKNANLQHVQIFAVFTVRPKH